MVPIKQQTKKENNTHQAKLTPSNRQQPKKERTTRKNTHTQQQKSNCKNERITYFQDKVPLSKTSLISRKEQDPLKMQIFQEKLQSIHQLAVLYQVLFSHGWWEEGTMLLWGQGGGEHLNTFFFWYNFSVLAKQHKQKFWANFTKVTVRVCSKWKKQKNN